MYCLLQFCNNFTRNWKQDNNELDLTARLFFTCAGKSVQHPQKSKLGGMKNADSFILADSLIGVADGVSSVYLEGVDPSFLPTELLAKCAKNFNLRIEDPLKFDVQTHSQLASFSILYDPQEWYKHILTRSATECKSLGSTTCLLIMLDFDSLWTVNLGDSQMILLRKSESEPENNCTCAYHESIPNEVPTPYNCPTCCFSAFRHVRYGIIHRSHSQQHYFNCPYQLTRMPDVDCTNSEIASRIEELVQVQRVKILPGDLLIAGTDGLFDNLFDDEISGIVNEVYFAIDPKTGFPGCHPQAIVDRLVEGALKAGSYNTLLGKRKHTPFSQSASLELKGEYIGGKPDDTTAVAAFISLRKGRNYRSLSFLSSLENADQHHNKLPVCTQSCVSSGKLEWVQNLFKSRMFSQ
ncbi:protein phosphatase 2C domain-containing protein [Cardiosporidium cionae]|uniref:Protein phosphatase n=1 Tax=Cardiosporidium cionae TaxID=476202 RepID=A0ABQ7J8A3_9APIC|nr:protein phosphatase 2C domain-containing protein [Cardiosporidium cionae]|eukprot:KAF8820200.1 protein phosphatase 2C domain-containing protein [Cardiosporidium cionae]